MQAQLTQLLRRHAAGEAGAFDELVPLVYDELRRLARSQRRRAGARPRSLNTTALAHEAYLRLVQFDGKYRHRGEFFAVAAVAMRQLLVDEARRVHRKKRGGSSRPITLEGQDVPVEDQVELVLAVDEALDRLKQLSLRLHSVTELRFFLGLTEAETASALGISERTVRRDWIKARAWLEVELGRGSINRPA